MLSDNEGIKRDNMWVFSRFFVNISEHKISTLSEIDIIKTPLNAIALILFLLLEMSSRHLFLIMCIT